MGYSAGSSDCIMSFSRWQKLMATRMPSAVPPAALKEPTAVADWFNEALQMAAPHRERIPAHCWKSAAPVRRGHLERLVEPIRYRRRARRETASRPPGVPDCA